MKARSPLATTVAAALGVGLALWAGAAGGAAGKDTTTVGSGAWSWFGDPRAVYYEGRHRRTYVGWIDGRGDVRVASVDSDTGARRVAVLKRGLGRDDHNDPSLLMLPGGKLEAFYSPHSGRYLPPPGTPSRMYYRAMGEPEDVSSFGGTHVVPTNTPGDLGYTYPNPVYLTHGKRRWLFWRGGNWMPSFSTRRSGHSWSHARTLIRTRRGRRPYLKVASDGHETIDFAFSEDNPSHIKTGIYYARYRGGRLERADGTRIGKLSSSIPIDERDADRVRPARSNRPSAWVHDVASDGQGRPAIVYVSYPSTTDLRYRYARFDGKRWIDREIVPAGGRLRGRYAGGISLDHEDPGVVYLSRRIHGVFEVERWKTGDEGRHWSHRAVTRDSKKDNVRPVTPRGETESSTVIWMRGKYDSYTAYMTTITRRGVTKARALP
jgi:putative BNR repeat neuraminidase